MTVKQIYDKGLAHGAYAVESDGKVALVDPGRDPNPYIDFAAKYSARIVAIFETHPHADFASSHLEFQKRFGAKLYINPKVGAAYDFIPLEDGDIVNMGKVAFKTLFTPGHSPDHNAYLLLDERKKAYAVFTGDSLFVGDVGRPDLREGAGNVNMKKEELAAQMYDTLQHVYKPLDDKVIVYPAHGGGSACGKSMSTKETFSTIGKEKERNWAMQLQDKATFVKTLLEGQVNIPRYFPYEVEMNRKGFPPYEESLHSVPRVPNQQALIPEILIIDTRNAKSFKAGHWKGAVNLPEGLKFEQWLGAIVAPHEKIYLLAETPKSLDIVIRKAAKIGYEQFIEGAMVAAMPMPVQSKYATVDEVKANPERFTIIDIRDNGEVKERKIFKESLHIPLAQLRERTGEVPLDKPIVVHCAGGYRSAIGSSILEKAYDRRPIFDMGEAIKAF